jgi:hypothetical protein
MLIILSCGSPIFAQSTVQASQKPTSGGEQSGNITGTVVDGSGAVVAGAHVTLTGDDHSPSHEVLSGDDGQFAFANVAPGSFHLTITSTGLQTQTAVGLLHSGEFYIAPPIVMGVATAMTEVDVTLSPAEVVAEQVHDEEKQRVLGAIPKFFVTYAVNPGPLTAKEKFTLAWKTTTDPVTFGVV